MFNFLINKYTDSSLCEQAGRLQLQYKACTTASVIFISAVGSFVTNVVVQITFGAISQTCQTK